jgi:UDP-N-acetylglucosamine 2-epimerase (non-hydrolysing)
MKKVIVFLGTRPEAIKLAPVIEALTNNAHFNTLVCSTGQHKEMLKQVIDFFNIPVHFTLDVMEPNQKLAELTAKILVKVNTLFAGRTTRLHNSAGRYNNLFCGSISCILQ